MEPTGPIAVTNNAASARYVGGPCDRTWRIKEPQDATASDELFDRVQESDPGAQPSSSRTSVGRQHSAVFLRSGLHDLGVGRAQ